uniref:AH domain-containing protein n=1 Tax=Heterorhabditis bacteriophora TaxID=37862 RepID=A0A1I7XNJ8_HETBA
METRHYESSTSGMNFDRFLDRFDESALLTMKRHYWTAKQLLRTKLGKKEDEFLLASDAELDAKLGLFRSVRDTSENLLACIENYQAFLMDATLCENELGKFLKERGKKENRKETTMVMVALGRAMLFSSHQRVALRQPLVRFYQELHVFAERAIADCHQTVDAVERARLEYRGSLLWMKKTSEELDPDTDRQLEKFREAQSAVRVDKERLDKLKTDTLQKVDLLSTSRSNLLSHLLGKYFKMLAAYYDKTSKAYTALASNLSIFQHYEFEILTDLIEPSKRVASRAGQENLDKRKQEEEKNQLFKSEAVTVTTESCSLGNLLNLEDEPDDSLKKYLFGRESPIDVKKEEEAERTDSPLGVLEESNDINEHKTEEVPKNISVGPLPIVEDLNAEVPRLAPPPSSEFANIPVSTLLSFDDYQPNNDTTGYSTQKLFPFIEQKTKESTKEAETNLVDLFTTSSIQNGSFPNPFDDNNFTEWDVLLSQCDVQQSNDLI